MLRDFQARLSGLGLHDVVAPFFTLLAQGPAHQALVIDNQDLLGRHSL